MRKHRGQTSFPQRMHSLKADVSLPQA